MTLSRILSKTGIIIGLLMVEAWPCYAAKVRVDFVVPEDSRAKGILITYKDDMSVQELMKKVKQRLEDTEGKTGVLHKYFAIHSHTSGDDLRRIKPVRLEDMIGQYLIDTPSTFADSTHDSISEGISSSRLSHTAVASQITFKSLRFNVLVLNVTNGYTLADLNFNRLSVVPEDSCGNGMEITRTEGMTVEEWMKDAETWLKDNRKLKDGAHYKYVAIEMFSCSKPVELDHMVRDYVISTHTSRSLGFKVFILKVTNGNRYTLVDDLNFKSRDS